MGILSTLLSGGSLVGKLCQVAAGALSGVTTYVDDETGAVFTSSDFTYDNTQFYIKKDKATSNVEFVAFNNDKNANKVLQFPTNEDGSSIIFEIPPKQPQEIGVDLGYCHNPDQVIGISTVNENVTASNDDPVTVRMRVNNLKVGDPNSVNDVNGYKINLQENGIHINTSRSDATNTLQNFRLNTESGVEMVCDQNISAKYETANDKEKVYPIDFKNYAIEENDKVSGELSLTLSKQEYRDFILAGEKKRKSRNSGSRNDDYRFLKFIGLID